MKVTDQFPLLVSVHFAATFGHGSRDSSVDHVIGSAIIAISVEHGICTYHVIPASRSPIRVDHVDQHVL